MSDRKEMDIAELKRSLFNMLQDIHKVEEICKFEGWRVVKDWLIAKIVMSQDELNVCDMDKIPNIRGKIQAYKEILNFPEHFIDSREQMEKDLKSIESSEANAQRIQMLSKHRLSAVS